MLLKLFTQPGPVLTVCFGLFLSVLAGGTSAQEARTARPPRPGDPAWPVAWASYRPVKSLEEDIADLKAHGVGLISMPTRSVQECRRALAIARQSGMKFHIDFPDITENAGLVRAAKLEPVDALMIGGVYRGKAIERHVFSFEPKRHEVTIEPPVYNKGLPYTRGSGGTGAPKAADRVGHYFPDIPEPVKAEIVVPLKAFDGQQHLKILPATVAPAPAGTKLDVDSVTADLPPSPEIQNRKLYRITFDLGGLDGALLNQVGIAVYWPYHGSSAYWMFRNGNVSTSRAELSGFAGAEMERIAARGSLVPGAACPETRRPWSRSPGSAATATGRWRAGTSTRASECSNDWIQIPVNAAAMCSPSRWERDIMPPVDGTWW